MIARSVRARFLLIVVLGAVLPLALVGVWLSSTAARSGRELLRTELQGAVNSVASDVEQNWILRAGDLQLLARNVVVASALAAPGRQPLRDTDSLYLWKLLGSMQRTIPFVSFLDANGVERWNFAATLDTTRSGSTAGAFRQSFTTAKATFPVRVPVLSEEGRRLGEVNASVLLMAVLRTDSSVRTVAGAAILVTGARGVLLSTAPDSVNLGGTAPAGWERVSRRLVDPPLEITLAASATPFVKPFETAARSGLAVLKGVALLALLLAAMMTTRVTRSLEALAAAADAVAAGDLQRTVDAHDRDEIGRVGLAFNSMTESLRRTLTELAQQRSLAAVGEFAASLSHEVRNALTAIRVDLQHALVHLPKDNAGTELVTRTLGTVRRLDATVTGALRVARSAQVQPSPVNLQTIVLRAMASAQPAFVASRATLELLPPAQEAVIVDGDASALEQLFLNLLLNAGQAARPGGFARIEIAAEGDRRLVTITDNGHGIPLADVAQIGEPFRSSKADGTGLGLSIAKRIAEAHRGDLRISSEPERGTTVVVSLVGAPE